VRRPGELDVNILVRGALAPLLAWSGMVAAATLGGYPGVICVTPMAWLMACWTGNFVAGRSRSLAQRRLLEALLAGAALGLGQGIIFYVLQALLLPLQPGEESRALVLSLGILGFGTVISGLLSLGTAALRNRRRGPS
jgi:hypothetical protein